ncbi:MAG: group 1 truncated hemoglobin [Nitrospiraceae bacterium]|nr:group 1 truncated hemoglobin [Nitrospiraceae bacterium]
MPSEGHLEHNLGLDLRLCAFRLHHLPKAIFDQLEYGRKPTKILHLQARLWQGYHIYTSDRFVREGGMGHMMKQFVLWTWVAGFSAMVVLVGCAGTERMPAGKSLYDRLGGNSSISALVDHFVANVAADTRINGRFATTDVQKLKGHLVDQVCMATERPYIYSGRDMKTTHAGMEISNRDFGALVENLVKALDMFKVPTQEKGELLGLLGPMKKYIVEAA